MDKTFNTAVVIGRFQPTHNAHIELLKYAGTLADNVIVIIGSAYAPRSPKNPWSAVERHRMMSIELDKLTALTKAVYRVDYNVDTLYDDDGWVARVQNIVSKWATPTDKIALVGFKKDNDTTRYLNMFPQWEYVQSKPIEILDATDIRNLYFSDKFSPSWFAGVVPANVLEHMVEFRDTEAFKYIVDEKRVIDAYIEEKKAYKYPIVAVTVDAVVVQSGHILLIKRRSSPGKGLWALPGGYFDAAKDDKPVDGIIRELKEETCIDVPEKVLRGSIKCIKDFSSPKRSQSGRSITFAAHISLSDGEWKLPKIKGADDAEKARWVPFVDVKRENLHDDHYDIIAHFVPLIK